MEPPIRSTVVRVGVPCGPPIYGKSQDAFRNVQARSVRDTAKTTSDMGSVSTAWAFLQPTGA